MSDTDSSLVSVVGECRGADLDKRTYLPGLVLRAKCPKCGDWMERDMADDYLSYPVVGERSAYTMCCDCDHEINFGVIVRLTLEVVP